MELVDVIKISEMQFYPSVKTALAILLAQPCTTCTIERSFSTVVLNRWSADHWWSLEAFQVVREA